MRASALTNNAPSMIAGGVAQLQRDVRRERAHRIEQTAGNLDDVAADHQDGHRLADGPAGGEKDSRSDARSCRRQRDPCDDRRATQPERVRSRELGARNGRERGVRHERDRGQDHDREHDDAGEQARAGRLDGPDDRDERHEPPEPVDNRGNAREQLDEAPVRAAQRPGA